MFTPSIALFHHISSFASSLFKVYVSRSFTLSHFNFCILALSYLHLLLLRFIIFPLLHHRRIIFIACASHSILFPVLQPRRIIFTPSTASLYHISSFAFSPYHNNTLPTSPYHISTSASSPFHIYTFNSFISSYFHFSILDLSYLHLPHLYSIIYPLLNHRLILFTPSTDLLYQITKKNFICTWSRGELTPQPDLCWCSVRSQ